MDWRRSWPFLMAFCALVGTLPAGTACAQDLLRTRIDALIAAPTADYAAQATPVIGDDEFLRRVSLDLTGRIPPITDVRAFLDDQDAAKREKLVDKLLASPEHARQMVWVFDRILMRNLPAKQVKADEWETFLLTSFAENKPWDVIVREILTADGTDPKNRGPARFYLDREGEVHAITRDVGRIFLGTNMECAQCHNHPEIDEWEQRDYYGLAAFFVRSFNFTGKDQPVVYAEKGEGEVSFESVFEVRDKVSKGAQSTPPRLFDGEPLSEPKFEKPDDAYVVKPAKDVRPVPKFSRRAQVADYVTGSANRRFPRTMANRLWALLLGQGLIGKVEYDHSDNPPSHPELLDLLTDELVARKYNLRELLKEIVLSDTYQRASARPEGIAASDPALFAQGNLKPLSPEQFAWVMVQSSGEADHLRLAQGDKCTEASLQKSVNGYLQRFRGLFAGLPDKPVEKFEATTEQTLFLCHDGVVLGLCERKNGNLVDRVLKLPADNPQAIADELFLSALTRRPTAEEVELVQQHFAEKTENERLLAAKELVWALLTSAENRVNH